jgi:hypothetical protein
VGLGCSGLRLGNLCWRGGPIVLEQSLLTGFGGHCSRYTHTCTQYTMLAFRTAHPCLLPRMGSLCRNDNALPRRYRGRSVWSVWLLARRAANAVFRALGRPGQTRHTLPRANACGAPSGGAPSTQIAPVLPTAREVVGALQLATQHTRVLASAMAGRGRGMLPPAHRTARPHLRRHGWLIEPRPSGTAGR